MNGKMAIFLTAFSIVSLFIVFMISFLWKRLVDTENHLAHSIVNLLEFHDLFGGIGKQHFCTAVFEQMFLKTPALTYPSFQQNTIHGSFEEFLWN